MKVFLSWSGQLSKQIAEAYRQWLPSVLQAVRPYFSPDDTEKGARWGTEVAKELEESRAGLLFVTRQNVSAPWLTFEAGALSKTMDKARVCPLLFGLSATDLSGPLVQFQAAAFNDEDTRRVLTMLNRELGEQSLPAGTLTSVFKKWWPDLQQQVKSILSEQTETEGEIRGDRDILEEILAIVRRSQTSANTMIRGPSPRSMVELIKIRDEIWMRCAEFGIDEDLDGVQRWDAALGRIIRECNYGPKVERKLLEHLSEKRERSSSAPASGDDIPF